MSSLKYDKINNVMQFTGLASPRKAAVQVYFFTHPTPLQITETFKLFGGINIK